MFDKTKNAVNKGKGAAQAAKGKVDDRKCPGCGKPIAAPPGSYHIKCGKKAVSD